MSTSINILRIRRHFDPHVWGVPELFGPDGWRMRSRAGDAGIIVTCSDHPPDPTEWLHASIARVDRMPDYDDLVNLHAAVWVSGWAYQVFAPPDDHVNIHQHALHLWGRLDGQPALPNFGAMGTI